MKIVGLTGGIGSGKSTVSQILRELGAVIIDTDRLGHQALQPGSQVWREVVIAFGKQVVAADGTIDRQKLGELVFSSPAARQKLEAILHPAIFDMAQTRLKQYRQQNVGVVVLEVPLLIEAGWKPLVDEVWVTTAPEAAVLKRLEERTGMSEAETRARIRSQLSSEVRIKHADVVIDTDCSLEELKGKVKKLWKERLATG